jgi:hypothetical protein
MTKGAETLTKNSRCRRQAHIKAQRLQGRHGGGSDGGEAEDAARRRRVGRGRASWSCSSEGGGVQRGPLERRTDGVPARRLGSLAQGGPCLQPWGHKLRRRAGGGSRGCVCERLGGLALLTLRLFIFLRSGRHTCGAWIPRCKICDSFALCRAGHAAAARCPPAQQASSHAAPPAPAALNIAL